MDMSDLESIITSDTRTRGELLAPYSRGGLSAAAEFSSSCTAASIVTGFMVPTKFGFAPENDGPPGAAALTAFLSACGVQTRLITDGHNRKVCEAAIEPYRDLAANTAVVPRVIVVDEANPTESIAAAFPSDLLVYVERLGPNHDGRYLSMRGIDLTEVTLPLDGLLSKSVPSIGIGDGGNEIGMGSLPSAAVEQLPSGERIHCVARTDALIVAGVSNWGAAALVAAVALREPARAEAAIGALSPERFRRCLERVADEGAVDGITGTAGFSVDGMDCEIHQQVLAALSSAVEMVM